MSRQGWPLKKIREFLAQERKVKVSLSRLCVYCQSRKIRKGRGEVAGSKDVESRNFEAPIASPPPPAASESETSSLSALLPADKSESPFTKFKPQQKS